MLDKIKKLRTATGLGINDCKNALVEADGDMDKAVSILRKRGVDVLNKRMDEAAAQGVIESYIHFSRNVGSLVEVNCQTDFVAKTDDFLKFAKDIAMHIAAALPLYIDESGIPEDILADLGNKKQEFIKSKCLLNQPFIKDSSKTVNDYLTDIIGKTGEKVVIRRFVRFSLGENEGKI